LIDAHVEKSGLLPPASYKKKILIKGKMVPFLEEEDEDPEEEKEMTSPTVPRKDNKSPPPASPEKKEETTEKPKKKHPEKCSEELSSLTSFSAVSFKGFDKAKDKKDWEMSSFSENKVKALLKKNPKGFVEYNGHHIARIYPKGTRFDSSNYDPIPAWNTGAHMVALNHQTPGEPLWINHGKFLDNGSFGYILKPEFLRKNSDFNPDSPRKPAKTLVLGILGGWQLPKRACIAKEEDQKGNVLNPYVVVKVKGVPKDDQSFKTGAIKANGFNPIWKKEFKIPFTVPELANVLFVVMNDVVGRDDFIAQYALQVSNIRPGIHVIPLKDGHCGTYEKAALIISAKFV